MKGVSGQIGVVGCCKGGVLDPRAKFVGSWIDCGCWAVGFVRAGLRLIAASQRPGCVYTRIVLEEMIGSPDVC
eukprot:COSAG01_NODE_16812_length_1202_cov_1.003626_2_plen_73_part_00